MSAAPTGWGIGTARRYSLYRFFNTDGVLLYVGVTGVPRARWSSHSETKDWWSEVSNVSVDHYTNREDLVAAEAAAILAESPRYNVAMPSHRRPKVKVSVGSPETPAGLSPDRRARTPRTRSRTLNRITDQTGDSPTLTVDIHAAGLTNVGSVRRRNEDAFYVGTHLVAVADGLGGHVGGDVASTTVIDAIRDFDRPTPSDQLVTSAVTAVNVSNRALRARIDTDPDLEGMGTTLVAMLWSGSKAAVVNLGDSRIYCRRNRRTTLITDDHVYGRLVSGATRVPGLAERLTRFVNGRPEGVSADVVLRDLHRGDRYLLCTDGLSSYVPEADIEAAVASASEPDVVADRLVGLALDQGGHDNVTVVVMDVR